MKGPGRQQALAVHLLTSQTVRDIMKISCKNDGWNKDYSPWRAIGQWCKVDKHQEQNETKHDENNGTLDP